MISPVTSHKPSNSSDTAAPPEQSVGPDPIPGADTNPCSNQNPPKQPPCSDLPEQSSCPEAVDEATASTSTSASDLSPPVASSPSAIIADLLGDLSTIQSPKAASSGTGSATDIDIDLLGFATEDLPPTSAAPCSESRPGILDDLLALDSLMESPAAPFVEATVSPSPPAGRLHGEESLPVKEEDLAWHLDGDDLGLPIHMGAEAAGSPVSGEEVASDCSPETSRDILPNPSANGTDADGDAHASTSTRGGDIRLESDADGEPHGPRSTGGSDIHLEGQQRDDLSSADIDPMGTVDSASESRFREPASPSRGETADLAVNEPEGECIEDAQDDGVGEVDTEGLDLDDPLSTSSMEDEVDAAMSALVAAASARAHRADQGAQTSPVTSAPHSPVALPPGRGGEARSMSGCGAGPDFERPPSHKGPSQAEVDLASQVNHLASKVGSSSGLYTCVCGRHPRMDPRIMTTALVIFIPPPPVLQNHSCTQLSIYEVTLEQLRTTVEEADMQKQVSTLSEWDCQRFYAQLHMC